jgi:hypothetical protein
METSITTLNSDSFENFIEQISNGFSSKSLSGIIIDNESLSEIHKEVVILDNVLI